MELYILSKQDLSILSICKLADYQINLDEETNAKSTFTLMKTNGLKKENYMVLNGLYRQFIFVIDDVQTEKESDVVTVTALDISNVFNRKVIEKNIDTMKSKSIEEFLANTISENFVNSDDTVLNVNYIEIYWHTNTQGNVATNAENGLYNFHTFLINCRQYKNIYTDFKLENLGNPQTVEGKTISVEARNRKIVDISLHGESTQNGTPTPDNRVEIENIEGKNILDISKYADISLWEKTTNYFMFTPILNEDMTKFKNVLSGRMELKGTAQNLVFGLTSAKATPTKELRILDNGTLQDTKYDFKNADNIYLAIGNTHMISSDKSEIGLIFNNYNIMIEEGTVATIYAPYNSLGFKDEGKNLFNIYAISENLYINPQNGDRGNSRATNTSGYIPINANEKYVITYDYTSLLSENARALCFFDKNKNYVNGKTYSVNSKKVDVSSDFDGYVVFSYDKNCTDIMFSKEEQSIQYEPYKSQTAYFPLSEGQKLMEGSYLADDGIHHNFKEGLANGTSTTFEDAKENGKFYCNQKASGNLEGKTIAFDTEVTDAIVQYKLAEEEIVPYTKEQQEAWDNIKNLTLFEGVNYISSDANMVLKYYPLEAVGLKFVLRIDIENKQETTELIDTTLPEVADYNKIYEEDVTAKVTAYIRENNTEYNLYLKTDRTTTTNKNDPDRASGKIEVISVDTADKAEEEALNVMKGNNYKHLVEFKITKTSKLMDITKLHIRKTYKNQNRRRYI